MKKRKLIGLVFLTLLMVLGLSIVYAATFTNPIVPASGSAGAADPWVTFKDGYYYYCRSLNDGAIGVSKANRLQDIGVVPMVTVWTPPGGTMYSGEIWAPEVHYINGKWYIYFAGDDGYNVNHRMYCLESNSQDAQGSYTFRGKVSSADNKWAIDGTVLQKDDGSLYFVWSGCENGADFPQNIYIAPMSNPFIISGNKVMLSAPSYSWEQVGAAINEGPEVIKRNGKIFIIYSASASWLNEYCLGQLTCSDGNVLNAGSWSKKSTAVFSQNPSAQAYGTGHASFTKSPNGAEDWIVYHAFQYSNAGWGNRSVRAQKFTWNTDGTPNFGNPVAFGAAIEEPAGTPAGGYISSITRLEAHNIPGSFIRHAYGRGRIDSNVSPFADSQWQLVDGLADPSCLSLESVNFPGCYLRHRNGEVWMDPYESSDLFKADATWRMRPGLASNSGFSFESYNMAGQYMRHAYGLLGISFINTTLDRNDATFRPDLIRLESHNFPGNYIRHANGRGRIDNIINPIEDCKWKIVRGLANSSAVSIESINYPGTYLRHRNGEIWKDANDGSGLFAQDATWWMRTGLANGNGISFESYNYPGNYIRHYNWELYNHPMNNDLDRADATFYQR